MVSTANRAYTFAFVCLLLYTHVGDAHQLAARINATQSNSTSHNRQIQVRRSTGLTRQKRFVFAAPFAAPVAVLAAPVAAVAVPAVAVVFVLGVLITGALLLISAKNVNDKTTHPEEDGPPTIKDYIELIRDALAFLAALREYQNRQKSNSESGRGNRFQRSTRSWDDMIYAINHRPEKARQFLNSDEIQSKPKLKAKLGLFEHGISCGPALCKARGDGRHAMGICTKQFCQCQQGNAQNFECESNLIYDAIFQRCKQLRYIRYCRG